MRWLMSLFRRRVPTLFSRRLAIEFERNRFGVTMVEWAMIAALVAVLSISVLATLGTSVSKVFSKVNAEMKLPSATAT